MNFTSKNNSKILFLHDFHVGVSKSDETQKIVLFEKMLFYVGIGENLVYEKVNGFFGRKS